jgi:hypothetical protein
MTEGVRSLRGGYGAAVASAASQSKASCERMDRRLTRLV